MNGSAGLEGWWRASPPSERTEEHQCAASCGRVVEAAARLDAGGGVGLEGAAGQCAARRHCSTARRGGDRWRGGKEEEADWRGRRGGAEARDRATRTQGPEKRRRSQGALQPGRAGDQGAGEEGDPRGRRAAATSGAVG